MHSSDDLILYTHAFVSNHTAPPFFPRLTHPHDRFPHISITAINPRLPFPYMDGKGAIPIDAAISFTNPNSFKAEVR